MPWLRSRSPKQESGCGHLRNGEFEPGVSTSEVDRASNDVCCTNHSRERNDQGESVAMGGRCSSDRAPAVIHPSMAVVAKRLGASSIYAAIERTGSPRLRNC